MAKRLETTHSSAIGNWKELYRAALFEADADKQAERIAEAQKVVVTRARELFHARGDNAEEQRALDAALYGLRAFKTCVASKSGLAVAA
jgi:hypothetical protein